MDDDFLIFFNASEEELAFRVPEFLPGFRWGLVLDTGTGQFPEQGARTTALNAGDTRAHKSRSLSVWRHETES